MRNCGPPLALARNFKDSDRNLHCACVSKETGKTKEKCVIFILNGSTALVGPRLLFSFLIYSILQSVGLLE
jgi:hypothetical protein